MTRCRRKIRDTRRWILGTLAAGAVWMLPRIPYPLLRGLCGQIVAPCLRIAYGSAARRNLQAVLGDRMDREQIDQIVREMTGGFAQMGAELAGCLARGPAFFVERIDDRDAVRKLREFEAEWPGGFVGVTAHVGNWEIAAQWMAHVGVKGVGGVMAKRLGNRRLNRVVEGTRRKLGMEPIYADDPPSKPLHVLRGGKMLGMLPDQDIKDAEGVFIEFMGRPAYTPLGPARLAWTARVPILLAFCRRHPDDTFTIDLPGVIYPDRRRPKGEELVRLTRAWSAMVEDFILAHPEQWAWFHNRWKTTPEKLEAYGRNRLELAC